MSAEEFCAGEGTPHNVEAGTPALCHWGEDENGTWSSQCGREFQFSNDGGPESNYFRVCPFCGRKLEAVPYEEDTRDMEDETWIPQGHASGIPIVTAAPPPPAPDTAPSPATVPETAADAADAILEQFPPVE